MNDEVELVLDAMREHGISVGLGLAVTLGARRVLNPSLDVVAAKLAHLTERGLENLGKTFSKVPESEEPWYPHPRTAMRVLNDASMYDDDVMQTYVAGLIAGSRNSDASDDRPIYYLTLIDGLTAVHLRYFHAMYFAVAQARIGWLSPESLVIPLRELDQNVLVMGGAHGPQSGMTALYALESAGLIAYSSISGVESWNGRLRFTPTKIGMLLYDWAHGFGDEDLNLFNSRDRPNLGFTLTPYTEPLYEE